MTSNDNPLSQGQKSIPQLAAAIRQLVDEIGGVGVLASRLGISAKNVDAYLKGAQQPAVGTRRALARLCGDHRDLGYWNAVSRGEDPPVQ